MKLKYYSWIPTALIMIMIFAFSAKPAVNSNESSLKIVNNIIHIYQTVTNTEITADQRTKLESKLNFIVRKAAHFSEYSLLAFSIAFHLTVWGKKGKRRYLFPIMISFLYAATDEYHQIFVPGRSGMFTDVLIDTSGAAFGTLFFGLLFLLITVIKKRKELKAVNPGM